MSPRPEGYQNRIHGRVDALRSAIEQRDWDGVQFHFANLVRGVSSLLASVQGGRLPDQEVWTPLQPVAKRSLSVQAQEHLKGLEESATLTRKWQESQMWANHLYTVLVSHADEGHVRELSIRRNDRQPVHDWRHFQMIKTQLAGAEVEALEIYPAESRLMDTANQYYLFCLRPGEQIPMGYSGPRLLINDDEQTLPGTLQRRLPPGWDSTYEVIYGPKP